MASFAALRPAVAFLALLGSARAGAEAAGTPPVPARAISFAEFLAPGAKLQPSARLLGLKGQRVRVAGFMARTEGPRPGAFFLCPRPTFQDEGGAGTSDLPPAVVLVRVPAGRSVPYVPQPVAVTGVLEVGLEVESDGSTSWIRVLLEDRPSLEVVAAPPGFSVEK